MSTPVEIDTKLAEIYGRRHNLVMRRHSLLAAAKTTFRENRRIEPSRSTIHSRWRKTSQSVSTTVLGSSPGDADIPLKKLHEWGSFLRADEVV